MTEAPPIRMSLRMTLREVARKPARKAFRVAKALDANIGPVRGPRAKPDGDSPTFRIRQALLTFRFAELLTRTPTPRPLRSSSWGYGFFTDPSPRSSGDCAMPTTPGITHPRAANSRGVHALAASATAHAHDPWYPQSAGCQFP